LRQRLQRVSKRSRAAGGRGGAVWVDPSAWPAQWRLVSLTALQYQSKAAAGQSRDFH
jgi:hypothetical protein